MALACVFGLCSIAQAQWAVLREPGPPSDTPLFAFDSPLGSIDYVVARGLRLGRTGFTIGGFTTLEIDKEEARAATVELDSVNLLILWEPVDFLKGFLEIEIGDLMSYDSGTGSVRSNPTVVIERVYGDFSHGDALNLRIGKFQTPVGIWNLVPAEPFTWTATEPVLVETAFDEHQTGGAFFGSVYPGSATLDYWLYGQFMDPLDPSETPVPADRSVGGRLRCAGAFGSWAVGGSFLASEQDHSWSFLGGVDAFWQIGPVELQSEFVIVGGDIPDRDLWDIYLQGVYHFEHLTPFLRSLHFVARYEHFDPMEAGRDANLWNVGLTWIPWRFLIVKAGYQFADRQTDLVTRGFFSSVSVVF